MHPWPPPTAREAQTAALLSEIYAFLKTFGICRLTRELQSSLDSEEGARSPSDW